MQPLTYELVCTGPCSPFTVLYDQAVARGDKAAAARIPLKHTRHVAIAGGLFQCEICKTPRKF